MCFTCGVWSAREPLNAVDLRVSESSVYVDFGDGRTPFLFGEAAGLVEHIDGLACTPVFTSGECRSLRVLSRQRRGDNIFEANLQDVVRRQREDRADAAFLVEEVPWEDASRYGVCDTNQYGEITDVVEKPDDLPSNLVMTGFYTFTTAIFHACHLVQPSNRDEYEISDAIDLLIQSGRTIDAIPLDGWRVGVGYPEDREKAEARLEGELEAEAVKVTDGN